MIFVLSTIGDKETAKKIGRALLEKKLIVCYNLWPVESEYLWQGQIEEAKEFLLFMKARKENYPEIEDFLRANSGYETTEVASLKPDKVNPDYLDWLEKESK